MKKLCLLVYMIPFVVSSGCKTISFSDFPEMTDAEYSEVTSLPKVKAEAKVLTTTTTFYSRMTFLKKRKKKLYGAWTDSIASACIEDSSKAYISAKSAVLRNTTSDPCPRGTAGYGEDIISVTTGDDDDGLLETLIEVF